ncbi:putative carbohydrate binding protein [Erwinia phage vB_EamM_RisingSun]|uniref:Putative carbohydrate binding protein n=1 Tax=Erwinia phage vB_EamM_RisingSun TaxID=2026080 RepID=A0A223LGD6_9CAUD|nr:putative carbohydrate binding protein [Erwinia phage vB_EamM_RisingSun]ASU03477.1 putative carbohydrate binding protein [Erwinia phage vB_EamM_RisingSun]
MKEITEVKEFTPIVPLLEPGDKVEGGDSGPSNAQAKALANRTAFLKDEQEKLDQKVDNLGPTDVGAEPTGAVQQGVDAHKQEADPHTQYVRKDTANKPNGYLQLDDTGKLPAGVISTLSARYLTLATEAERLALTKAPDLTICAQVDNNTMYYLNANLDPSVKTNWITGQSAVVSGLISFHGRTGVVEPEAGDYDADDITETPTREFVTPQQKQSWSGKQDTLVSGVNIATFNGKSILGKQDLKPADIGCAETGHKHVPDDITGLNTRIQTVTGNALVAGSGAQVVFDPETGKTTIGISGSSNGSGLTVITRNGSTAGQTHSFLLDKPSDYSLMAQVLKEEIGTTNQSYPVDSFDAASAQYYDMTSALTFNGVMQPYSGELYTLALNNGYYQSVIAADGVSLSIDATAGDLLIPTMTSDSVPSGYVITQSSSYNSSYMGWKAFNGNPTDPANRWSTTAGAPQWLQMQLPVATDVAAYVMQTRPDTQFGGIPAAWTLAGSNDGTTWTPVDSRSGITWTNSEKKTFTLANKVNYRYFRLTITAVTGNQDLVTVSLFNLMGPQGKAILKASDGHNYTAANGTLTQVSDDLSLIDFDTSGFSQSGTILASTLVGKLPITLVSKNPIKAQTRYLAKNQIAKMKVALNGYQWAKVNSAAVVSTQTGNGKVRIAVSRDNKNFFAWSGSAWVSLGILTNDDTSAITLINQGMSPATIAGLTSTQWMALFGGDTSEPDVLAFAYGLQVSSTTDVASLDSITLNVNNASLWKVQTPTEVEIRWNRKSVSFKTVTAGNYKFIYQTPR